MDNGFVQKGGLWVIAQNLLMLSALVVAPLRREAGWHWSWFALGAALFLVGAVFGVAGVRTLGRNLTPFPRPRADSQLVQSGIYAVVRHPLYSSLIFASLGWALLWSSLAALALVLGLAVVLDAKARREERWLAEKFPEYAAYARRVRKLLPWVY